MSQYEIVNKSLTLTCGWNPDLSTLYATLTDDEMPAGEDVIVQCGFTPHAVPTIETLQRRLQAYWTLDDDTIAALREDQHPVGPLPLTPPEDTHPYSVLLKYPEAMTDGALETYYAFVQARDPVDAVHVARIEAVKFQGACGETGYALRDFALLVVIEGHHMDFSYDESVPDYTKHEELVTCRYCDTPTPKAYAGPNKAGDGWIGEECWRAYWEAMEDEENN